MGGDQNEYELKHILNIVKVEWFLEVWQSDMWGGEEHKAGVHHRPGDHWKDTTKQVNLVHKSEIDNCGYYDNLCWIITRTYSIFFTNWQIIFCILLSSGPLLPYGKQEVPLLHQLRERHLQRLYHGENIQRSQVHKQRSKQTNKQIKTFPDWTRFRLFSGEWTTLRSSPQTHSSMLHSSSHRKVVDQR